MGTLIKDNRDTEGPGEQYPDRDHRGPPEMCRRTKDAGHRRGVIDSRRWEKFPTKHSMYNFRCLPVQTDFILM